MSDDFNPETATMEDLRKAADEQAAKDSTKSPEEIAAAEAEEQRLADEAQATEDAKATAEAAKKGGFTSERTIDLGDGGGVQVFKGKGNTREDALEDLTNKLADAQRNASRKIREQEVKIKANTQEAAKPEDEAILSEQMLKNPTDAFKKMFKSVTGVEIDDFKTTHQKQKAFLASREKEQTGNAFVTANPDYADTPRNGKLINKFCELHNDFSLEGLNKAYQDLNESGLLDVKGEEASAEQKKADAEAKRIADAAKADSSSRTRRASGLSTQRRSTVTPTNTDPTEEELATMPLDKLKALANKQLATA